MSLLPKMEVEIVVNDALADEAIKAIVEAARTGEIGDGRVFVFPVLESYRIRTGEKGSIAIEPCPAATAACSRWSSAQPSLQGRLRIAWWGNLRSLVKSSSVSVLGPTVLNILGWPVFATPAGGFCRVRRRSFPCSAICRRLASSSSCSSPAWKPTSWGFAGSAKWRCGRRSAASCSRSSGARPLAVAVWSTPRTGKESSSGQSALRQASAFPRKR